jgi:hypothetical protein
MQPFLDWRSFESILDYQNYFLFIEQYYKDDISHVVSETK